LAKHASNARRCDKHDPIAIRKRDCGQRSSILRFHGAYDAIVLACMTLAVLLPLLLSRRARDRIDRIASSRWLVHR
jgi:hypothetical protein